MAIETLVDDELPEEPDPDDELPEELAWAVPVVEEAWAEPDGAVTEKLLPVTTVTVLAALVGP